MKKVLFVASTDRHINGFHGPYLNLFKQKGWNVSVATCEKKEKISHCDKKYVLCQFRNPFKLKSYRAIKQLKTILKEEHFDIIHCHTPMGAVITRLAAKNTRKSGTRVFYTAHGFHFYKGAPILNWLLFYPVEWYLSKYTDKLITINREDFDRANKKFSKRCQDIQYVPGVGVDPKRFRFNMDKNEKDKLRASLGLKKNDFVMIYPARLDKNKNQKELIYFLSIILKTTPNVHLLLPGRDEIKGHYQKIASKLQVNQNVHFLGRRNDIPRLLKISNLSVSSSRREGLPVNLLEACISGVPILTYDCRGAKEIVDMSKNGYVYHNKDEFIKYFRRIYDNKSNNTKIDERIKEYYINNTIKIMQEQYEI